MTGNFTLSAFFTIYCFLVGNLLLINSCGKKGEYKEKNTEIKGKSTKKRSKNKKVKIKTRPFKALNPKIDSVQSLAQTKNGRYLAAGGVHGSIKVWTINQEGYKLKQTINNYFKQGLLRDIDFSDDGEYLLVATTPTNTGKKTDTTGYIHIWRYKNDQWERINGIPAHTSAQIESISFQPKGEFFVSVGTDKMVSVWQIKRGRVRHTELLKKHNTKVYSVAFSPDGKYFATGGGGGIDEKVPKKRKSSIHFWHIEGRKITHVDEKINQSGKINTLSFSPNGQYLASGTSTSSIGIYSISDKKLSVLTSREDHSSDVWSVEFSHNSKYLASGSEDKTVRLWRVQTSDKDNALVLKNIFKGHQKPVKSVVFDHKDKKVISGSEDKSIIFWETLTK